LLKFDSWISESKRKLEVPNIDFEDDTPEEIKLNALQSKFDYAKVTVRVKIYQVTEAETVRTGKKKQEVKVADQKSTAKVTLWEDHISSLLAASRSYKTGFEMTNCDDDVDALFLAASQQFIHQFEGQVATSLMTSVSQTTKGGEIPSCPKATYIVESSAMECHKLLKLYIYNQKG